MEGRGLELNKGIHLYKFHCVVFVLFKLLHYNTRPFMFEWQDNKDSRYVKIYKVSLKDKDLIKGPWAQNNIDNRASLLIPVPLLLCCVIDYWRKSSLITVF